MLQSKLFSFSEEPPTNEKASTVCKKNLIVQCNLSLLATPTHPKGLVIYDRIYEKGDELQKDYLQKKSALKKLGCPRTKLIFSHYRHLWSLLYICMKFEATTMLPVHTRVV